MARSDLMISLVQASLSGSTSETKVVAEAIIADERAKKHTGVADRLERVLRASKNTPQKNTKAGLRVRDGSGGIKRVEANINFDDLYLTKDVREACEDIINEQRRADLLRAHGMEPRHKILMVGPPGNGKTSLAEAIAYELALPLFVVRYDAIITSYLGETAQRLRRLFDFVRTEPCVLFFDEFDAIGKERGDTHETGEIKRVVTTLLMQMDDLPSYNIIIGATNHPELLDRAAWRRFQIKLKLDRPTEQQLTNYFSDKLKVFDGTPGYTAKRLVSSIDVMNFSEAEGFILDIRRQEILSQGSTSLRSIIADRIKVWNAARKALAGEEYDGISNTATT